MMGCSQCRTYMASNLPASGQDMAATGYVCRTHHAPVSWRGHGCAQCRQETVDALIGRAMARQRARNLARDKAEAKARGVTLTEFRTERRFANNPHLKRDAA
jgi:hypothetical protein